MKYLLCAIDLFSKCTWVVHIKDKKGTSIANAFQKIISEGSKAESKRRRKPNKILVDQGSEFYNNSSKDFLKINNIEMYSTVVVAERFIRMMKNKIFKHMTATSKNVYFNVFDNTVNKYNNTVHRTIKMKPVDVKDNTYAEYNENSNKKDPKFKVGDRVRISKYKNIFAKGYAPNWSEVFVVRKIKNTVPWTYVVSDLNEEKITGSFHEKELQKTNQKEIRIEKKLVNCTINCMLKGKDLIVILIVGLIKKISYKNGSILS